MSHFAVIAPPFTSHVRALEALAMHLLDRGHRVTWVHQADVRVLLRDQRLGFASAGANSHAAGTLDAVVNRAARPGGPWGLRRVILDVAAATDMLCREAPAVLRSLGVDAVIADQMEAAGGLVAEHLGLPWVSVACALPVNREPRIPLPVMPWGYAHDARGERLNEGSTRVYDWLMGAHRQVIESHARSFGLGRRASMVDCLSPFVQISQTTPSFDFPREHLPAHFYPVGPLRATEAEAQASAFKPRPGRPFVFASLGTLQGGRLGLFRRIAQACKALDAQLLVAHCDRLSGSQADILLKDGASWVTGFAHQCTVLAQADAVVTHAGLNTVLDACEAGTPMLALPIAFDQPGVAARVVHAGAGLRLLPVLANRTSLRNALQRVLSEPRFADRARALGDDVRQAGGAARAADIVESVLAGQAAPVVRRVRPGTVPSFSKAAHAA